MLKPKSKQLHRPFDENGTLEGSPETKLMILLKRNARFALTMLVLHLGDPGGPGSTPGGGEGLNPGRDVERGVAVKTPPSAMCGTPSLDICAHPSYHH